MTISIIYAIYISFITGGHLMGKADRGWAGNNKMGEQGGWVKPRPLLINSVEFVFLIILLIWSSADQRLTREGKMDVGIVIVWLSH